MSEKSRFDAVAARKYSIQTGRREAVLLSQSTPIQSSRLSSTECELEYLARGLERDGSIDGGGGVKSHESDHSKTSVLDLGVPAFCKGFWALILREAKGVEKSRNHVLSGR
jgi:hypothetical protein